MKLAESSSENVDEKIIHTIEKLEEGMELLGVTAVEDKLQENV